MVGGEQSLGVGATFALGEADVVDDLAEEGRQLDIALGLDGGGAGLANCPAIRPTLTTGRPPEYVRTTAIWRMARTYRESSRRSCRMIRRSRLLGAGTLHLERHGPTGR